MEREYTYAELCRMTKKRVIRIAGYKNMKAALRDKLDIVSICPTTKMPIRVKLSKKFMARMIASDR